MKHTGIGVILENQLGEIVLHLRDGGTSRMPNQWCLMGGQVEAEEDIFETAVREVQEESSVEITESKHLGDFYYEGKSIALMYAKTNATQNDLVLGEGAELRFIPKDTLPAFIKALPYENPYLNQLVIFLDKSSASSLSTN